MSPREIRAFCLAPAAAPTVAAVAFGGASQLAIVAVISYVAAFVLGAPLFLAFRRVFSLTQSCLGAAVIAGSLVGTLLMATLLFAVSPAKFVSDPAAVAWFCVAGLVVGAGLGLAAGLALWVLSRPRKATPVGVIR